MTFTITINPYILFAIICALVILYLIKRGYYHSKHEINTKAQRGQHIY